MPLEIDMPELDTKRLGNIQVTHNGLFICPANETISQPDLLQTVDYHRLHFRQEYEKERRYFEGDHDILKQRKKPNGKPDNRIVVNFPRKANTTFNGFFIGTPVKVDSPIDTVDEFITKWTNINSFADVNIQTSKYSSMYGRSYYLVYQDTEGLPNVVQVDPLNTFLIYDDTLAHNVKYGVTYSTDYDGNQLIDLYDVKAHQTFKINTSSEGWLTRITAEANPYPIVPIIEAPENEERMPLTKDTVTLIDALDKAMSEKGNDVDYFADAYMKIINATMTEEDAKKLGSNMRDERLVVVDGNADQGATQVDFMDKPNADENQEHLINRLVDYIYQIASITNMNDEAFAGNPSGVTLQLKYEPMKNMANAKALKFEKAMRSVFRCVFAVTGGIPEDAWQDLTFKFTQSIPENLYEEAQAVSLLSGHISNHTLFSRLPFVDDPEKEIERMKQEQQDTQAQAAKMLDQYLPDQKKGGVTNGDNAGAAATKDPAANKPGQSGGQAS